MERSLDVSRNLQELRLQRDMTMNDLAKLSGVSVGTLARHEHGCDMTISQLFSYAEALECSVDDILYGPMPKLEDWSEDHEARYEAECEKLARRFGLEVRFTTRQQIFEEMSEEG